jgi:phosphatidylserine decarboxylase
LTSHKKTPDGAAAIPDVSPDLPALHWRAILHLMRFLPQGALSRGFGHIADIALPRPLRRPVLDAFAKATGIDASEAEKPLAEYGSINEFFVRRLRPGARTIDHTPEHVVAPVDGVVGQCGPIRDGILIQAKGLSYSTTALLDDSEQAARFDRGTFVTIYLSPRHYHRIHAPIGGRISGAVHLPGMLFPVNAPSVLHVQNLFPRNERLVCYIDSARGAAAVVAVGAYNVGRISAAFDTRWRNGAHISNRAGAVRDERRYDPAVPINEGDEIMAFHLGSTVVMLFEHVVALEPLVGPGMEIRMGSVLGRRS